MPWKCPNCDTKQYSDDSRKKDCNYCDFEEETEQTTLSGDEFGK